MSLRATKTHASAVHSKCFQWDYFLICSNDGNTNKYILTLTFCLRAMTGTQAHSMYSFVHQCIDLVYKFNASNEMYEWTRRDAQEKQAEIMEQAIESDCGKAHIS